MVVVVVAIMHYYDVIMGAITSLITSLTIVYSTVYLDADQRKHQSSASLTFVQGFHRGPVNSPHKSPVTRKMFPFDDAIMRYISGCGGAFSGTSGTIVSPNYPNNYDDNMDCVYHITVATGKVHSLCPYNIFHEICVCFSVLLCWFMLFIYPYRCCEFQVIIFTFTDFNLESQSNCNYDSVTVHDGDSINALPLGKFCGSVAPPPTTTSGNSATLRFKTDGSTTRPGFSVDYVASDGANILTGKFILYAWIFGEQKNYIFINFSTLTWHRKLEFFLVEGKDLPSLLVNFMATDALVRWVARSSGVRYQLSSPEIFQSLTQGDWYAWYREMSCPVENGQVVSVCIYIYVYIYIYIYL